MTTVETEPFIITSQLKASGFMTFFKIDIFEVGIRGTRKHLSRTQLLHAVTLKGLSFIFLE